VPYPLLYNAIAIAVAKPLLAESADAYVLTSEAGTDFIVPPSLTIIPSLSAIVIELPTDVPPSSKFISVVVAVTPSKIFNSEAVDVTPSKIFNSSGVDVICVVLAAARTGKVPDWFGKLIVLSAVGSTVVSVVS
jgi:hypothetical protein